MAPKKLASATAGGGRSPLARDKIEKSEFCWSTKFEVEILLINKNRGRHFVDQHSGDLPYWDFCWSIKNQPHILLINKIFAFFFCWSTFWQILALTDLYSFVNWPMEIVWIFFVHHVNSSFTVALWGLAFDDDWRPAHGVSTTILVGLVPDFNVHGPTGTSLAFPPAREVSLQVALRGCSLCRNGGLHFACVMSCHCV